MLDKWVFDQLDLKPDAGRKELDDRVLEKLNEVLQYAKDNSAFYAKQFKGAKADTLKGFASLPFVYPDDVAGHGTKMLCTHAGDVKRIVSTATSGSSGEPKRVYFSEEDLESTVEYFAHGLDEFVIPGDRALILFPGNAPDGLCDLISRALKALSCEPYWFGYPAPERYGELLDAIEEKNISFLIGTAASMAQAARYSLECGRDKRISSRVRGVLASAAFVDEKDRLDIMRIWSCAFDEHYSMTETGYALAVGCSCPCGYHIWESGVYVEIVDPVTGKPKKDGEEGEVVVTTLNKRAMPFIRYRTGDIGRIVPGKCSCGSCLKRLERIHERPVGKKFEQRTGY